MSRVDDAIMSTQGSIKSAPTVAANNNLGTTATLIRDGGSSDHRYQSVRVRVLNPNASARLAIGFASGVKADVTDANCGTIILPEQHLEFSYSATLDLYLVADSASSEYQVSWELV